MRKPAFQNPGDLERFLREQKHTDSVGDFDKLWRVYRSQKATAFKEVSMAEKKGGFKVIALIATFLIIVGVGWFGLTRFAMIKQKEKLQKGESIVVTMVVGTVEVKKMGSTEWRTALVEDVLAMGDAVRTSSDAYCELQIVNRGIFRVESTSEVYLSKLVESDGKVNSRMKLEKGEMALKPNKLKDGETFEIETATAVAAVRGTKFSVRTDEAGNTSVDVVEGKVAVTPSLKSIDQAREKGLIDAGASDAMKNDILKPVEVVPGESVTVEKQAVDNMDRSLSNAIATVAAKEGVITIAKMEAAPTQVIVAEDTRPLTNQTIWQNILSYARKDVAGTNAVSNIASVSSEPLIQSVVKKTEVSEESRKKLETLSEDRIIKDALALEKVTFNSDPAGAVITLDGSVIGVTPLVKVLEKGRKYSVEIAKDGFDGFKNESYEVKGSDTLNARLKAVVESAPVTNEQTEIADTNKPDDKQALKPEDKKDEKKPENVVKVEKKPDTEVKKPEEPKVLPGSLVWKKSVALPSVEKEPLFYRGRIFVADRNRLRIISPEGVVIRNVNVIPEGNITRPVASEGVVYVGSDMGGVFAYDVDGNLVWKNMSAGQQKFGAWPGVSKGFVAVPSVKDGIKIYKDGKEIDAIPLSDASYAAPLVLKGGTVLVYATERGDIVSYSITDKKQLWTKNLYDDRIAYPLLGNDYMVLALFRNSGTLAALNPENGAKMWSTAVADIAKTKINPMLDQGKVLLSISSDSKSTVVVVNAGDGKVMASTSVPTAIAPPFLFGDTVYIGGKNGTVYSFNLNSRAITWRAGIGSPMAVVVADSKGVYAISGENMARIVR